MDEDGERRGRLEGILEQMDTRLSSIEGRLTSIETRLEAKASTAMVLGIGAWLSLVMTVYRFWP